MRGERQQRKEMVGKDTVCHEMSGGLIFFFPFSITLKKKNKDDLEKIEITFFQRNRGL